MAGWIKIYRDLQDHWLAQDMEKLGRWISLLLMATHETKKVLVGNQLIELKRGQIIASNSFLAEKWDTSERTVLRFLELLEKDSMLHRCTHRKVTILTICNYDSYQEKSKGKRTDSAPIAHQSVTENKNEKEDKEINITTTAHTHMREENFDLMVGVLGTIEQYAHQYQKENIWADAAMMAHLTIAQTQEIFNQFVVEQKHNSARHSGYSDFKRHFLNYLRTKAERNRQQSKQSNNGNQRKYDDRRGTEVSSSADYTKPL